MRLSDLIKNLIEYSEDFPGDPNVHCETGEKKYNNLLKCYDVINLPVTGTKYIKKGGLGIVIIKWGD